jgi:hypothetical protein
MKTLFSRFAGAFLAALVLTNCQPDEVAPAEEGVPSLSSLTERGQSRVALAKLFAQAMEDPDVLALFHQEADKRFDMEDDVMPILSMDKAIPNAEQTLLERLAELHSSKSVDSVAAILEDDPLLTLTRMHTSANKDRKTIPLIAVQVAPDKVIGFGQAGVVREMDMVSPPADVAVWALRTSDRVQLSGNSNARIASEANTTLTMTSRGQALLLPNFHNRQLVEQENARAASNPYAGQFLSAEDLAWAYDSIRGCNECPARDALYRQMSFNNPDQRVNPSVVHEEGIPWIEMSGANIYNYMMTGGIAKDHPAAQESWVAEGNAFELDFYIMYSNTNTVVEKAAETPDDTSDDPVGMGLNDLGLGGGLGVPNLSGSGEVLQDAPAVFKEEVAEAIGGTPDIKAELETEYRRAIPSAEDLFEFDANGTATATKRYYLPTPWTFTPWHDNMIGNSFRVVVREWDPEGIETTYTISDEALFSRNFGFYVNIDVGDGKEVSAKDVKKTGPTPPQGPTVPGKKDKPNPVPPVGKEFVYKDDMAGTLADIFGASNGQTPPIVPTTNPVEEAKEKAVEKLPIPMKVGFGATVGYENTKTTKKIVNTTVTISDESEPMANGTIYYGKPIVEWKNDNGDFEYTVTSTGLVRFPFIPIRQTFY